MVARAARGQEHQVRPRGTAPSGPRHQVPSSGAHPPGTRSHPMRFSIPLLALLALLAAIAWLSWSTLDPAARPSTVEDGDAPSADRATAGPLLENAASDSRSLVTTMPTAEHDVRASLPPTSLRGRVVDPSGASLPGATITVSHSGSTDETRVVADSTGAYAVDGLRALDAIVAAELDGFVRTGAGQRTVNLVAGGAQDVEDLVLARPISLRGIVVDDANAPVAGADVRAVVACRTYDRGIWELPDHLTFETRSEADGRFAFALPPEPSWTLTSTDAGARVETRLELDAMHEDLVVALPILRAFTLDVVDADSGAAIVEPAVVARFHGDRAMLDSVGIVTQPPRDSRHALLARRTEAGRFEFDARVDTAFDLGAGAPGYAYRDLPRLTAAPQHVVARLTRIESRGFRVRVLGEDGEPLVGLGVALFSRADGGCGLEPDPHGFRVLDRVTDARGEVVFEARSEGPFQAMLAHEPYPAARTEWFPWSATDTDTTKEIRVESAARIRGRIRLGGEALAASVDLRITRDDGWRCVAYSDRDGIYVTPALAPGRYRVMPFDAPAAHEPRNDREVDVSAGRTSEHDVDLAAFGCGAIAGTLRFDGEPAPGMVVGVPLAGEAVTDAAGAFVLAGVPVGPTTLEVRRAFEHAAVRAIEVEPGAVTRVDLDLAMTRVRGRVLSGATRAPIVEALITWTPLDAAAPEFDAERFDAFTTTLESGPDGSWAIAAIECGDYVMTVEPFVESSYATTARLVRVERDGPEILTLLDAPASIALHVPLGSAADTIADARRIDAPWREPRSASRDSNGAIALEALESGAWAVTLWSVDDEDRRTLLHDFGTVMLAPGETKTLSLPR